MNRELFVALVLSLSIYFARALAVDICENQLDGTRLAYPDDCTKFVVCRQSGIERILTCPLGLHFNRFDSICDLRERAACQATFVKPASNNFKDCTSCLSGCGKCVDTPTPGGEDNVSGTVNNTSNNGDKVGPSTGPSGTTCVNSGKCIDQPDGQMFADPKTTGFIICESKCQIEMPCAPGTKFNESLNTCDRINAGESGSSGGDGAHNTKCYTPGKCAGQPNGALLPNPHTHTGYLQCQHECEVEKSCAPGTIFNETLMACVNADDGSVTCSTSRIKCTSPGKCAGKSDGTIFSSSNATAFIVCLCECEQVRSCDPDTIFHESLSVCIHVNGNGGSCELSGEKCNNPGKCLSEPDGAIHVNPKTTFGYIECQCECEVEKPCVTGTIFNKALKLCVHMNGGGGVNCDDNSNVGNCSGGEGSSGSEDGSGGKGGGSCGSGNCGVDVGNVNAGAGGGEFKCDNPGKCASQPDGTIFASPNAITGYIECRSECELKKSCVPGTIFNETLKLCVHVNGVGGLNGENNSNETICASGEVGSPADGTDFEGACGGTGSEAVSDGSIGSHGNDGSGGCKGENGLGIGGEGGSGSSVESGGEGDISGTGNEPESGVTVAGEESSGTKIEGCGLCKNSGKCIDKSDGEMFNSLNSTGYIVCISGCQVERPCATGTIFDETLKTCIHIDCEKVENAVNGSGCSSAEGDTDISGNANVQDGCGCTDDACASGATDGESNCH